MLIGWLCQGTCCITLRSIPLPFLFKNILERNCHLCSHATNACSVISVVALFHQQFDSRPFHSSDLSRVAGSTEHRLQSSCLQYNSIGRHCLRSDQRVLESDPGPTANPGVSYIRYNRPTRLAPGIWEGSWKYMSFG